MAYTALAFYRKSQNLDALNLERPKSIETVRKAIRTVTEGLLHRITLLERCYYEGKGCDGYISSSHKAIIPVMLEFDVTYIHAAYQMSEIREKLKERDKDDELKYYVDPEALDCLDRIHKQIQDYLPNKFQEFLISIAKIVETIEKYCLSFYDGDTDLYMETARHYQAKAKEFKDAVEMHVGNIIDMAESYRSKKGLGVRHFGLCVNEIARRNDVCTLPFLLAFPQACENIKNSCRAIHKWIDADEDYASFIAHDVMDLQKKKEIQNIKTKSCQEELYTVEHKIKTSKHEMELLKTELAKLRPKEIKLQDELSIAQLNLKFVEMDLNNLKKRQVEMRKIRDSSEDFTQLSEDILELQLEKVPTAKAEVEQAVQRMKWLVEKREKNESLKKEYRSSKQRMIEFTTQIEKEKQELHRIDKYLVELKRIHANKTSQESMKKIFHEMPVQAKNNRNQTIHIQTRQDHLERAIDITAFHIHQDWAKLYRTLPFHPDRGRENIDKDLDEIITKDYRSRSKEQAKDSLERWMRLHTRASLSELKRALEAIKRHDIVDLFIFKSHNKQKKKQKVLPVLPNNFSYSSMKKTKMFNVNSKLKSTISKRKGATIYMETKSSFMPLTLPSI